MAFITLNRKKLRHNYEYLDSLFKEQGVEWAVVSKLLCGNELFIREVLDLGTTEVCDSRISNLRTVKEINPEVETVYIKPPAHDNIYDIVRFADASFNTEFRTIKWLSEEAGKQNKVHKVIIMIELGDLREGIMGDHLMEFYGKIFKLPNIEVTGIGANLNCLHGVMPSQDKLVQLSLYEQLIEAKFGRKIKWVSGGTSVTIPLVFKKQLPKGINHFRVGETLYFGADLFEETTFEGMHHDVFKLHSQVIEITKKPIVPIGTLATNPSGELTEIDENDYGRESYRALLDIGLLDVNRDFIAPEDDRIEITGASSDMLAIDLGTNPGNYKVGDMITFDVKYMAALGLFNSDYVDKKVVDE